MMDMVSTAIATGILALAFSSVASAEFRPGEQLVLMDCGFSPNGDSALRTVAYYADSPWDGDNNLRQPDMLQHVPAGDYPWRIKQLDLPFPNGDVFSISIIPEKKDADEWPYTYAGFAGHIYDSTWFYCYGFHERDAFRLPDNMMCGTAYICHHDPGSPMHLTRRQPPTVEPTVYERETTVTLSSDTINIDGADSNANSNFGLVDPKAAFAAVWDSVEGNTCKTTRHPISEHCTIKFDCTFSGKGGYLDERRNALAKLIEYTGGLEVAKTEFKWTTYSSQWGVPTYHQRYVYPRSGKIVVSAWEQGHEDAAFLQSMLGFEVECEEASWFCRVGCNAIATSMIATGYAQGLAPVGVFGTLLGGACNEACG